MTARRGAVAAVGAAAAVGGLAACGDDPVLDRPATVAPAVTDPVLRQALSLVRVPTPEGWTLREQEASSGDPRAQADLDTRTITVFLRPGAVAHRVAHDLAHEYAHALDADRLDDAARLAYLRERGAPDAPWFPGGTTDDYASGAGDLAEVFATCVAASPDYRSRLAPPPADACAALPKEIRP